MESADVYRSRNVYHWFQCRQKSYIRGPESIAIKHFEEDIKNANYDHTKELFRIQWKDPVDYTLLEKLIDFNITDKADCQTFWR